MADFTRALKKTISTEEEKVVELRRLVIEKGLDDSSGFVEAIFQPVDEGEWDTTFVPEVFRVDGATSNLLRELILSAVITDSVDLSTDTRNLITAFSLDGKTVREAGEIIVNAL